MGRQTLPHHILAAMRGRPRQNAAESQHHRIKRLQDELRQAQAALKISEERRASIVGAAVLRHVRHDDDFAPSPVLSRLAPRCWHHRISFPRMPRGGG